MSRRILRAATILLVLAAVVVGASQLLTATASGCPTGYCHGRVCPTIVAPVICDGGCVYVNGCYAACAGAKHCVRFEY